MKIKTQRRPPVDAFQFSRDMAEEPILIQWAVEFATHYSAASGEPIGWDLYQDDLSSKEEAEKVAKGILKDVGSTRLVSYESVYSPKKNWDIIREEWIHDLPLCARKNW